MNYLAHAYLSFTHEELLVGNMISDFVKGKTQYEYPPMIQKGIRLHRSIDAFTDDHPATREARMFLKPAVGSYSGAFIDVIYDHFLANDDQVFTDHSLRLFADKTYQTLEQYKSILPLRFQSLLPYMIEHNWLYNYKSRWGVEQSFGGVVRRAKYLQSSREVFSAFESSYLSLQKSYSNFFPSLKEFAAQQLHIVMNP